MSMYLQRTQALNDIDILRVSLEASESTSTQGVVVFELFLDGKSAVRTQVSAQEMKLPKSLKEVAKNFPYSQPSFVMPESVTTALRDFTDRVWPKDPLWLELNPPGSVLSIVPWESLLQAKLEKRLLRLSFFPTSSYFPHWDWLDVVICVSAPNAKDRFSIQSIVPTLVKRIIQTQPLTTIHLFTDSEDYPGLATVFKQNRVKLYNPATAAQYEPPGRSRQIADEREKVTNPWLRWMMDSLSGQTIDLVYFLCHGFLYTDQGALALAESPTVNKDTRMARFVGPRQLNTFLDCIGAYSSGFCSPASNYSIGALRLLSEQIARLRPGVSMLHNSKEDPSFDDLCMTYGALFSTDQGLLTRWSSSTSLYCSPNLITRTIRKGVKPPSVIEFNPAIAKDDGAWVNSGYRWLERTAAQISEAPAQPSTQQAVTETLNFVSNIINQYSLKK